MKMSRRTLLGIVAAAGALTAATGLVGAFTVGTQWWDQPADTPFEALELEEAAVVRAVAAAAFPGGATIALGGGEAELDRFFDGLLLSLPEMQRSLLKLLLHALEHGAILAEGDRLSALPEGAQRAFVMGLLQHELAEVRGAAMSLVVLLGMGYTTHPTVAPMISAWHRCGYGS
jgi:hypothetical protein